MDPHEVITINDTQDDPVEVSFNLSGFRPDAVHAIHIHSQGDTTRGCASLGPHLNLTNMTHGSMFINIEQSHTGDLVNNLWADSQGDFVYAYDDPRLTIIGDVTESIIGCSLVIHKGVDDLGQGGDVESLITGNAGERMVCAIIGKSSKD